MKREATWSARRRRWSAAPPHGTIRGSTYCLPGFPVLHSLCSI